MKHVARNLILLLAVIAFMAWSVFPPKEKLRLGKDLAGGVSLIYGVDVPPGDTGVLPKVIEVVKDRLDPQGVLEITIVPQGNDRIEITMPLPTSEVKQLKEGVDSEIGKLAGNSISPDEFAQMAAMKGAERDAALTKVAAGSTERLARLKAAMAAYDAWKANRAELDDSQATLKRMEALIAEGKAAGRAETEPDMAGWASARDAAQAAFNAAVDKAASTEIAYEDARNAALTGGVDATELRRALALSNKPIFIRGAGENNTLPSPRETAIEDIKKAHPDQVAQIDRVIAAWNAYEAKRKTLDDPSDIIRQLRGAGVLNFRITINPGTFAQEAEARRQLETGGPKSVRVDKAKWYKINKIQNWVRNFEELQSLDTPEGARAFFGSRGYVVEKYKGEFWMLAWDEPGFRLTEQDGDWKVDSATVQPDQFGRPGIGFQMDVLGAQRLGELTETNVGRNMAILLDDQIYTAPRLNSRIGRSGIIEGNFNQEELTYITRVLSAGSLQARLSPEPISTTILAPTLGADNLQRGLESGYIAFGIVTVFMVGYYFMFGFVAIVAMAINALLLVGAMAVAQAAFSLPGIAGIVLTFGQAIDANVLIYERIREEVNRGHDLKTAVRLGYDRALAAIVDGNITTLIVCVVLGFLGTQEIKGFGLTLGIGVVTTLFAQLFATRLVFAILIDRFRIRKMSMFALAFPAFGRALVPKIDWMKMRFVSYVISFALTGMGAFFVFYSGRDLLGIDFRGGTAVTIVLKDKAPGVPNTMTRAEVESHLDPLRALTNGAGVEVIVVNPDKNDFTKSNTFRIKTIYSDAKTVQDTIVKEFTGLIESRPALVFDGAKESGRAAPVYPLTDTMLGDSIGQASVREPVEQYLGGAAIVLRNIQPPVSVNEISDRLRQLRAKPEYGSIQDRETRVVVLDGTPERATSAAVLVRDAKLNYMDNRDAWASDLRDTEWNLAVNALSQASSLSSVESFGASVAGTFRNSAIASVVLATILIIIYVWVRFGSFRYSGAAILTTLHDCLVAVGLVAIASVIYNEVPGVAHALGILPFKIDLNLVAAVLAILGYSLNDTIIIMDRIRELRGKLPYATRKHVNDAINQTISRTIITSGTTLISVMVLYLYGGEGVREFAYVMLCGLIVGTYSSIAVAAPLVWVRSADPHADKPASGAQAPVTGGSAATA